MVGFEGFGLAAAAVQSEHELTAEALPQRVVGDHPAQLGR
jgi:hypothetical protein